jgi:calcium-dependent protein kinase
MGCGSSKEKVETKIEKRDTFEEEAKKKPGEIIIQTSQFISKNSGDFSENYKIGELLGSGSFGKVYKVLHIPTNQLRAMKVVLKDKITTDEEKDLEKEITVLSQLDHPNIIKIYEYFESQKSFQIIQELASGGELFDKINEIQVFNENIAAAIVQQLLSSVTYLHSKKIVHRDLKPENILLETKIIGDHSIKLIDFGTANFIKKDKLTLQIGTAYYMAPEIINQKYDEKCDVWSCGVIMYILLCGYPPFYGIDSDDDSAILESIIKGKFSMEGREWEKVSKEGKNLIKKMLTYDPSKRPSAEQCLQDVWISKYRKDQEIEIKIDEANRLNLIDTHKLSSKFKLQQASVAYIVHQISTNEVAKNLRTIFKQMDESGDGKLTYQELKNGWKKYFKDSISEIEFEELIKLMDQDNNLYIEYEEFLRVTINREIVLSEKNLEMAFNFFDKDKSGKLSAEEVKHVLGIAGDNEKNKAIVREIISEVDTNNDGEISLEEFKVLMSNKLNN